MRVLMVIRPDALTMLGGDTVQMQRTAAELRSLGVEVEEAIGPPSENQIQAADLIHLFNLQTSEFTLEEARRAEGKPIALSTIYWDFAAERLLSASARWKLVARLVGRERTMTLLQRRVEAASKNDRDRMREVLRRAHILLPNSNAEVEHLRHLTEDLKPVRVVPNAVDPERHRPGRELQRPLALTGIGDYVLIAARIEPHKNQLAFCRALKGSGKPVVLAGPTPDPPYVEACRAAGATWIGALKGDELDAAMAHCRAHALPSFRETPGLASLEAAALGCAVVTTSAGSTREYFGKEAEYCDPASEASMRQAVERAWKNGPTPGLSDRIRREFSWAKAAEKTLDAYREILT